MQSQTRQQHEAKIGELLGKKDYAAAAVLEARFAVENQQRQPRARYEAKLQEMLRTKDYKAAAALQAQWSLAGSAVKEDEEDDEKEPQRGQPQV